MTEVGSPAITAADMTAAGAAPDARDEDARPPGGRNGAPTAATGRTGAAHPPTGAGLVADPVGEAERRRDQLAAQVTTVLTPGDARGDDTLGAGRDVYVGWFAALDARSCPARYRAQGAGGWGFPGWSAPTAAAAAGRAALDHHLAAPARGGHPPPLPAPLAVVRAWMKAMGTGADCAVGQWVGERLRNGDAPELAATAAGAARWLAGFVRVLGWPLPDGLALFRTGAASGTRLPPWRPERGSPVTVASGADARLGRVVGAGGFSVVVHRPTGGDDVRLTDRAAFEALAATLTVGVVPAEVLVTVGDTGERLRVPIDGTLLDAGAALVVEVVRQRVIAAGAADADTGATPSAACHRCERRDVCAPGAAWLSGAGRWRGGLPSV